VTELAGVGRQFVRAAMSAPYLSRADEIALARRWRQHADRMALDLLIGAHMRLAIAIAGRFRRYGLPIADLIQEGHVGLMEAAARYEPERQVRFSTYATWWVRAAMQDFVLRNWSIVRGGTSSGQKSLFFALRRLRAQITREALPGEVPDVHGRIATRLGVTRADVAAMEARLASADLSLNAAVIEGEGGAPGERQDFLVDDGPLPDDVAGAAIDGERLRCSLHAALGRLTPRERDVLQARRLGENVATLQAIGVRMGISKERVRQIESRAIGKLKQLLIDRKVERGQLPGI